MYDDKLMKQLKESWSGLEESPENINMQVYVILTDTTEDASVERVFSSLEKARNYIIDTRYNNDYYEDIPREKLEQDADFFIHEIEVE